MAVKLTKRVVDATEASERDMFLFDSEVRGFALKVTPIGSKIYVLSYRMGGRETPKRRFTIGRHGSPWTVDMARKRARELLEGVRKGEDPLRVLAGARAAAAAPRPITVRDAFDRFEASHLASMRSGGQVSRVFKTDVLPRWGDRSLIEIARRDVLELLDAIEGRGSSVMRNRSATYVSSFFSWTVSRDLIAVNPVAGVTMLAERSRDRVLTDVEIRAFWQACAVETTFSSVAKVLLLTAQRRNEVASMRWSDLDLDKQAPLWTIPREIAKNDKAHEVPLAPAVIEILRAMPNFNGSDLVFTIKGKTQISGFSKEKRDLDERMTGALAQDAEECPQLRPWRLHDLRRTAATGLARLGFPVHVVEKVLNHTGGTISGIAGVYNRHAYLEERRLALAAWAAEVARIVEGELNCKAVPLAERPRTGKIYSA